MQKNKGLALRYNPRLLMGLFTTALVSMPMVSTISTVVAATPKQRNTIIFVTDGLRPSSVNPTDTKLKKQSDR